MSESRATRPTAREGGKPFPRRIAVPSWLISVVFHVVVLLGVALPLWSAPRLGVVAERTAEVGIVLKHQQGDDRPYYESHDGGGTDMTAAAVADAAGLAALLGDRPPLSPSSHLPPSLGVIGPAALEGGGVGTAIGADTGPRGTGSVRGGLGRTSVFGIGAEGQKFAYVFDRSESMTGPPLEAAKAELVASLQSLEDTHQFQIIFYNDRVARFSPTGDPNRLFFATEQNKNLAAKFIGSVVATSSTDHEQALMLAINLQPDVIFFLTDADRPGLSARQLERINRRASGITIHAIEFGFGPQGEGGNFLDRLARDNGGTHGYVDVFRLSGGG
jgi:hypothetical protein